MSDERLLQLGFSDWPFPMVPDDFIVKHMCGRAWLSGILDQTLEAWRLRSSSMINLLWADVGAGKTHTIRHLQYIASNAGFTSSYYFEMPDRPKSFVDFHNTVLSVVGLAPVLEAFMDNERTYDMAPVLRQVCRAVFSAGGIETSAENWISGIASTADLRKLGIPAKLSIEQAVSNVIALVAALRSGSPQRTLLFVDEFQRVAHSGSRVSTEIQAGLSSLINRLPESLGLVLSFAAEPSATLPTWMQSSIISRAGRNHLIPIMSLSNEDAKVFLRDIMQVYGPRRPTPYYPFDEAAINKLVSLSGGNKILPRDLLSTASYVLQRNLDRLMADSGSEISSQFVTVGI